MRKRSPASRKRSSTSNRTARKSDGPDGGALSRRVVVTGVGLVSPLGIGTQASWDALCAGQNGMGPTTPFDAAEFSCRIAGEVSRFDPLQFVSKKDVKKMD